jgi:hypothetical protein
MGAEKERQNLIRTYESLGEAAIEAMESATPSELTPPDNADRQERQIMEIVRAVMPNKETGGFSVVQNIYTEETNYAEQQREATKQLKQWAREVYAQ